MALDSSEIHPAPAPAEATRTETPESRAERPTYTRKQVEDAFYSLWGQFKDARSVPPELRGAKKRLEADKKTSLDHGRDTSRVDFEGEFHVFSDEEYPKVQDLITYAEYKLKDLKDIPERKSLQEQINILRLNSRPFYREGKPHRTDAEQMVARVKLEASRIAEERGHKRITKKDKTDAALRLSGTLELVFSEETPPPPPPPPGPGGPPPDHIPQPGDPDFIGPVRPPGWTEPTGEFIGPVKPEGWRDLEEIVIINGDRTEEAHKFALFERDQVIREAHRQGSWFRKIGITLGEDFYRADYGNRLFRAKLESGNSHASLGFARNGAIDAERMRTEENAQGEAAIERIRAGRLIEGEKRKEITGEIRTAYINEVLKPIAEGTATDSKQVQKLLKDFVQAHANNPDVIEEFGPDGNLFKDKAEYFATNALVAGKLVQETMNSNHMSLEAMDPYIKVIFARISWGAEQGEVRYGWLDRQIASLHSQKDIRRGQIWNPASVGAGLAVAGWLGGVAATRSVFTAASAVTPWVPGAGLFVGATFGGLRRYHQITIDNATGKLEDTYNQKPAERDKKRDSLVTKVDYDKANVGDLVTSLNSLLGGDLSRGSTHRQQVIMKMAEIRERLEYSRRNSLDLIRYTDISKVQEGKENLLSAEEQAINRLADAAVGPRPEGYLEDQPVKDWVQKRTEAINEIKTQEKASQREWHLAFDKNIREKNAEFNRKRIFQSGTSALRAGAIGFVTGGIGQELLAGAGRALGAHIGNTGLENLILETAKRGHETLQGMHAAGAELPPGFNPGGATTAAAEAVSHVSSLHQDLTPTGTAHTDVLQSALQSEKPVPVSGHDGLWDKNSINVDEHTWEHGNDQLFHTLKQGDKLVLDFTRMHGDISHMGVAFTTPDGHTVFVPHELLKDNQLVLDPNSTVKIPGTNLTLGELDKMVVNKDAFSKIQNGDFASELNNHRDVFNVKFIEAAQLNHDGVKNILDAQATIQGTGALPSTIDVPIEPPAGPSGAQPPGGTPPGQTPPGGGPPKGGVIPPSIETPKPTPAVPSTPPGATHEPLPSASPSATPSHEPSASPFPSQSPAGTPSPTQYPGPSGVPGTGGQTSQLEGTAPFIPIPFELRHHFKNVRQPVGTPGAAPTGGPTPPPAPAPTGGSETATPGTPEPVPTPAAPEAVATATATTAEPEHPEEPTGPETAPELNSWQAAILQNRDGDIEEIAFAASRAGVSPTKINEFLTSQGIQPIRQEEFIAPNVLFKDELLQKGYSEVQIEQMSDDEVGRLISSEDRIKAELDKLTSIHPSTEQNGPAETAEATGASEAISPESSRETPQNRAIDPGTKLIQRDGRDVYTVADADAEKVTLEKKRPDGSLESRITLNRAELEDKLRTPGSAWGFQEIKPVGENKPEEVTPPTAVTEAAEAETDIQTETSGVKILDTYDQRSLELAKEASDARQSGNNELYKQRITELSQLTVNVGKRLEDSNVDKTALDRKRIGTFNQILARSEEFLSHPNEIVSEPAAAAEEPAPRPTPADTAQPPAEPELPSYLPIEGENPVDTVNRINNLSREDIIAIAKSRFGENWDGSVLDFKIQLMQEAVAAKAPKEASTSVSEASEPEVPTRQEVQELATSFVSDKLLKKPLTNKEVLDLIDQAVKKGILNLVGNRVPRKLDRRVPEIRELVDEAVDKGIVEREGKDLLLGEKLQSAFAGPVFVPSGDFAHDVEKINNLPSESILKEGKRRFGKEWEGSITELRNILMEEAKAAKREEKKGLGGFLRRVSSIVPRGGPAHPDHQSQPIQKPALGPQPVEEQIEASVNEVPAETRVAQPGPSDENVSLSFEELAKHPRYLEVFNAEVAKLEKLNMKKLKRNWEILTKHTWYGEDIEQLRQTLARETAAKKLTDEAVKAYAKGHKISEKKAREILGSEEYTP